jgi:phosphodiesterase/alkaline phosphatase D-like protein
MKLRLLAFVFSFIILDSVTSQTIVVEPYLQDAEPNSMVIMWETSSDNSTSVEYGLTASLGLVASGTAITGNGTSQIHTVYLTGLAPNSRYYYKAITGTTQSAIYQFNTPALPEDESTTGIVAMSDMQQDWLNPTKFYQVIHDGVLQYMTDSVAGDLPDNLQMVIIPGDLVDNGSIYAQ